jgi:hypothetical protein
MGQVRKKRQAQSYLSLPSIYNNSWVLEFQDIISSNPVSFFHGLLQLQIVDFAIRFSDEIHY